MTTARFRIDLSESFAHLPAAPIEEAVIHWRARAAANIEPETWLERLKSRIPEYPNVQRQQEIGVDAEFRPEGSTLQQHQRWHGYRFESVDHGYVASFSRDGLVVSRLRPYENWEKFEAEATRLWEIYRELGSPDEIQRMGVRFINLIAPIQPEQVSNLLVAPPRGPNGFVLPVNGFLHQTKFEIPGGSYRLNAIQTLQPPCPPERESFALIVDFDVGTTRPMPFEDIEISLLEMRWVKNKAFFSFMSQAALEHFRSSSL